MPPSLQRHAYFKTTKLIKNRLRPNPQRHMRDKRQFRRRRPGKIRQRKINQLETRSRYGIEGPDADPLRMRKFRRNIRQLCFGRHGAPVQDDDPAGVRPSLREAEQFVKRCLRSDSVENENRLNSVGLGDLLHKSDLVDRVEEIVIETMPDIDDFRCLVMVEQGIEKRHLTLDFGYVDDRGATGKSNAIFGFDRIGVESRRSAAAADEIVCQKTRRRCNAGPPVRRTTDIDPGFERMGQVVAALMDGSARDEVEQADPIELAVDLALPRANVASQDEGTDRRSAIAILVGDEG